MPFIFFRVPQWAEDMMDPYSNMTIFIQHGFKMCTHTTEMKKLKAGFLIKEMLDRFADKIQSKLNPDRRLWLYSGHDLTITHFLNAIDLYDVIFYHFLFLNY